MVANTTRSTLDHLFRHEYGKMVAHLTRVYGTKNIEYIEDAVQEALVKAMQTWPFAEVPANPSGWIFRVAKNKLIDTLRREAKTEAIGEELHNNSFMQNVVLDSELKDDQLRMIFACCHPAISEENRIILTLKLVGGFGKEEIAAALLKKEDAVAKAYTRAKATLKAKVSRLEVPTGKALEERLHLALKIIYLLFNEGYNATSGDRLVKDDVCVEAIRLGELLSEHKLCNQPVVHALLALMYFQGSRLEARANAQGELLTLEAQDRSLWNNSMIQTGIYHLSLAADDVTVSEYHIQAGMAYYHCIAPTFAATDWQGLLALYDTQMRLFPSPVAALNRSVVLARVKGTAFALKELDQLEQHKAMKNYHLFHAIKGELHQQSGHHKKARAYFAKALELTNNTIEQQHLAKKLNNLE